MTLVNNAVEVCNEILFTAFVLSNHFLLSVGIHNGGIVLLLTQGSYLVGISTCLLVQLRDALDDAVGIPLRLVLVVSFQINASYGSCVPNWSGDGAVDRLNDSLRLSAAWIAYWVRLCVEVPLFTVLRLAELDRHFSV